MKTHIFLQNKHQLRHNIVTRVNFANTRNCLGLSMMASYKLTERTTKTEKIEKILKILKRYIIFKTFCYELSVAGELIHSTINCKLMRSVSILRLPKEYKKPAKKIKLKKQIEREKCRSHQMNFFFKKNSVFNYFQQWNSTV